jgi:tetratricopeptide (TPR) repeat protein
MTHAKDADELREKYYHSMGAALTEEGDLEEAVVFFQKAIDIHDTPYAWYGLARALSYAGDLAGAVGAMTRAIKLAPGIPEYYHERGTLLGTLGRPDLADDDIKKAISIDSNYERIDTIRRSVRIISEAFTGPVVPGDVKGTEVRSKELGRILDEMDNRMRQMDDVFDKPSCPVTSCPAYCCHFTGKLLLHGVTVGPWKLQSLRESLREKGPPEEDLLEAFPLAQAEHCESLFSPRDIIPRGGGASVTFPRQKDCRLGRELARDIPKGQDYRTLMWISENAKPCIFLTDGKCSIYDVGGDPSLDSCASFLCMTGFIFVALKYLGFLNGEAVRLKAMAELNDIAVDALIILARDVYGSEEAAASNEEIAQELKTAIEHDRLNHEAPCSAAIERYDLLKVRHESLTDRLIAAAGQKIARLFEGKP